MSNQQQRNINGKDYLVNEKIAVFDLHEKPSSNVAFFGLNYAGHQLFVQFKSGSSYVYNDVPDEILNAAMTAQSIGSFISATVSKTYGFDKHNYKLVVDAPESKVSDFGICSCGVPHYLHQTACGWLNAAYCANPQNDNEKEYKRLWEAAHPNIKFSIPSHQWLSVTEKMPEDHADLLEKSSLDVDQTKRLLVLTNCGSIVDNRRIKMQVGEKEWVWFMNIQDEEITHYMVCPELPNQL